MYEFFCGLRKPDAGAGKRLLRQPVLQRFPGGTDVAMILNTAGSARMEVLAERKEKQLEGVPESSSPGPEDI